ncbi:MAG TPA: nitroreductase [Anaerolineales bacterium]|nr:nitroreductase [Anaerolineales bacterium]
MDALQAIQTRHSIGRVKPDTVPRELIEKLLNAAVQAPNHYLVRPWRFVVLTGRARSQLGEIMAQSMKARFPQLTDEALNKERAKPLRSPVLIAVGVDKPTESKVLEIENICAAAAACENILLAAQALGLAGQWRTGDAARDGAVKKFLGFAEDQHIISFLYIGYPDVIPEAAARPGFEDRTVWKE